jgi:hypothetical protein
MSSGFLHRRFSRIGKVLLVPVLEGIRSGASTNISPWGFKGARCKAPLSADTRGYVEVAISVLLAEAGNVKTTTVGIPEGNMEEGSWMR